MYTYYQNLKPEMELMASYVSGVSEKYGVADYWYFKNGTTQQYYIFRQNKYNFYLDVCEISTPIHVKGNLSYEHERNDGSNGS